MEAKNFNTKYMKGARALLFQIKGERLSITAPVGVGILLLPLITTMAS